MPTTSLNTGPTLITPQYSEAQWHFRNSPQLLALNQTMPIWISIRREMWPDCLVCSFPALATLATESVDTNRLSRRLMVPSGG